MISNFIEFEKKKKYYIVRIRIKKRLEDNIRDFIQLGSENEFFEINCVKMAVKR